MHKLRISPKAKNDLVEIKGYITGDLCNPQSAKNLVSKITKKLRLLSDHPGIGAPLSSVLDIQTDYRFLVCDNYLIFYRREDEDIFVTRIIYSKRNYLHILFGDLQVDEE